MNKIKFFQNNLIRNVFAIIGVFSSVFFLFIAIFITYSLTIGNREKVNFASKNDVRFVLNWCELGDSKIDDVLKSYVSENGFSSDHHEAYLIKIKNFNISELQNTQTGKWYRGDQLPEILKEALKFGTMFNEETPWFLEEKDIFNKDCFVYPWYIGTNGLKPSSVQIIIIKPKLKLIYYISASILNVKDFSTQQRI